MQEIIKKFLDTDLEYMLQCEVVSKTLTKGRRYKGYPVKKGDIFKGFNARYTTRWVGTDLNYCTSFLVIDDTGILRAFKRKRFSIC